MKFKFSVLSLGLLFMALFTGCNNEEKQNGSSEEVMAQVSFSMNIQDKVETRAIEEGCLDQDSLKKLANDGLLKATVTVLKAGKTEAEDKTIAIRYVNGGFVADPIELPRGKNQVTAFTVHHINNDLLFSAVAKGSKYEAWVDKALPQTVEINDENLYKKTTVNIYVLCAFNEEPEDFGYIKWNIHFVQIYCIPFSVNVCNSDGEDVVGRGTLMVEKGTYTNYVFTPIDTLSTSNFPPETPGTLSDLCFPYDNLIDPESTYLRYTMTLSGSDPIRSVVNIATLLKYKEQPEWSKEFNYLHLWFCNCETWFFENDCDRTCTDSYEIDATKLYHISQLKHIFKYWANSTWINGLDGKYSLDTEKRLIVLPVNSKFKTTGGITFHTGGDNGTTTITSVLGVSPTTDIEPVCTLSILDRATNAVVGSKTITSLGSESLLTFTITAADFPKAVEGVCYNLVCETTTRNIYLRKVTVGVVK